MGELASIRKYLYWSERRVQSIAEDNGIDLDVPRKTTLKSPSGLGLPQIERELGAKQIGRHEKAKRIEQAVGALAVSDFVTPPPVRFAQGVGSVVLSDFVESPARPSSIISAFTTSTSSGGCRVAVCLFGSFTNLADVVGDASPLAIGWSSSSAPAVSSFLQSRCAIAGRGETLFGMAIEAINISAFQGQQGMEGDDLILREPWRRGFTYGHIQDVGEWYAEVFLDLDLKVQPHRFSGQFDRVIIGAPLWIRTPQIKALRLYDEGIVVHSVERREKRRRFKFWPLSD